MQGFTLGRKRDNLHVNLDYPRQAYLAPDTSVQRHGRGQRLAGPGVGTVVAVEPGLSAMPAIEAPS